MLKTLISKATNSKVWPSNHVNLNCASSKIIMFLLAPAIGVTSFGLSLILISSVIEGAFTLKLVELSSHKGILFVATFLFVPIATALFKGCVKVSYDLPLSMLTSKD